jgi:tripartite-type tricarboxylate transporter receptor subunit TctC
MFTQAAKAPNTLHVPFQGAAPGLQALLGGQIDLMMVPLVSAPQYRSKLRTYGVASLQRADSMKDVPTLTEAGVRGERGFVGGLVARQELRTPSLRALGKALRDSVSSPDVAKRIIDMSVLPINARPRSSRSSISTSTASGAR